MPSKKIVVGMSGGVDSSMAMLILKREGWEPVGVSLKLARWEGEENRLVENACCTEESFAIVKKVCEKLGTEHYVYDVGEEFEREVIGYFTSELEKGRTPNPCLVCNRDLKFAKLIEWADLHGIEKVASGHYAKVEGKEGGKFGLYMAADLEKDQTYGLCMLGQGQLSRIVLPLGDYTKEEVYAMAKEEGFEFFLKRRQSQDLCFVSSNALRKFIGEKAGVRRGKIVDCKGRVWGEHEGLQFYTRGQRCGISGGTVYYADKFDSAKNLIVAASDKDDLMQKEIFLENVNYLGGEEISGKMKVMAKIRHGPAIAAAGFEALEGGRAKVVFEKEVYAPMRGQFCAFYSGHECLGGGEIC